MSVAEIRVRNVIRRRWKGEVVDAGKVFSFEPSFCHNHHNQCTATQPQSLLRPLHRSGQRSRPCTSTSTVRLDSAAGGLAIAIASIHIPSASPVSSVLSSPKHTSVTGRPLSRLPPNEPNPDHSRLASWGTSQAYAPTGHSPHLQEARGLQRPPVSTCHIPRSQPATSPHNHRSSIDCPDSWPVCFFLDDRSPTSGPLKYRCLGESS